MLSISHVFVGAAVGAATGNPVLGFLAGILSHHVLDQIPHWDVGSFYEPGFDTDEPNTRDYAIATVDSLLAVGALWWLARGYGGVDYWPLIAGGVGGLTPDIWHHIPIWKHWTRTAPVTRHWFKIHERFHWTVPQRLMWWGLFTQAVAIGLSWWWLAVR